MTFGSLFQLAMFALLVYQAVHLSLSTDEVVPDSWSNFIKILYLVGLFGPILNWIFIYFLIVRMNEKVRSESNPNFLET